MTFATTLPVHSASTPDAALRSLYVCYLSLDDPLVQTQVVAYLEGLAARGHTIHLLTFEPARLSPAELGTRRAELDGRGITWHSLRYHKRPSLPATAFDVLAGCARSAALMKRHRLEAFHARSHIPAAMGLILSRVRRAALIFDIRGLLAEEYIDAGNWKPGSLPFRLTKWVERRAIQRAAGIVVLTQRLRRAMFSPDDDRVHAIPCCVDVPSVSRLAVERARVRERLGLTDRTVLVYVGKFSG